MAEASVQLERQLKALGSRNRLAIVRFLKQHKTAFVSEIASELGISIMAASQHLRVLRAAGVVRDTRRSRFTAYRLVLHQPPVVKAVLQEV